MHCSTPTTTFVEAAALQNCFYADSNKWFFFLHHGYESTFIVTHSHTHTAKGETYNK